MKTTIYLACLIAILTGCNAVDDSYIVVTPDNKVVIQGVTVNVEDTAEFKRHIKPTTHAQP